MKVQRYNMRNMPDTVITEINLLVDEEEAKQGRKVHASYIIAKLVAEATGNVACKSCYGLIPKEFYPIPPENTEANKAIWNKIRVAHAFSCSWYRKHKDNISKEVTEPAKSNVIDVSTKTTEKVPLGKERAPKSEISGLEIGKKESMGSDDDAPTIKVEQSHPEGTDTINPMEERLHPDIKSKNKGNTGAGGKPPVIRQDELDRKSNDALPGFL